MSYTPGESFELDVLHGISLLIAGNPKAKHPIVYVEPDGNPPAPSETGIYFDVWPEIPGDSLTLSDYAVTDDMSLSDSVMGLQLVIRSKSIASVKTMASDQFSLLHGLGATMLGEITLVSARRVSGTPVTQDSNGRLGRTENYYLQLHRPSENRL